jgi:hypothetical protein
VRVSTFRAGVMGLLLLPLAAAPGHAQAPLPGTGFVPPYEIMRTVRSAGFDPLAPPLREGTTYVLRATDFRGILMRVVVDAHSGAIRDVNRIVSGPGPYGQIGMVAPPPYYGAATYGPPGYDAPDMTPGEEGAPPAAFSRAPAARTGLHPRLSPPLPRPRPASLATRDRASNTKSAGKSDAKPNAKTTVNSDAATMLPPATSTVPGKTEPSAPLND